MRVFITGGSGFIGSHIADRLIARGDEVMVILQDLHEHEKTTIVMVTHDETLAARTQRTVRLFDGRQVS